MEFNILARMVGGSHLYGLNTPESDLDERYIFSYTDIARIIGLDKTECIDSRDGKVDELGYEVRRFLQLLRKTNTQVVEMLFAPDESFTVLTPIFKKIRENKLQLIDQEQFYKSMRGYIQNEIRLANGERTGDLGGKRKAQLDKYGFSPKNFVQLIRLCKCGISYFIDGDYPVRIRDKYPELAKRLLEIKTEPERFTKERLNEMVRDMELDLQKAYAFRQTVKPVSNFNMEIANQILFDVYFPILEKHNYEKNCNDEGFTGLR